MTVSEFTREDDLSMSIATDTQTEQLLELIYRNGSERNFRVDMISMGLKCKRDKKMRWRPTMINGLFPFLQEEILWVIFSKTFFTKSNWLVLILRSFPIVFYIKRTNANSTLKSMVDVASTGLILSTPCLDTLV